MLLKEVNSENYWSNKLRNNDKVMMDHTFHFVKLNSHTNDSLDVVCSFTEVMICGLLLSIFVQFPVIKEIQMSLNQA